MSRFETILGLYFDSMKGMNSRRAAIAALITSFCLFAGQVTGANELKCEALTFVEAAKILKEANEEPGLYCDTTCSQNVHRLYDYIINRHPHLEPKDFHVIYIARPGILDTRGWIMDNLSFSMDGRNKVWEDGKPREWWYHVVLEHNGQILDLDESQNPKPVEVREYFNYMFPDEFDPRKKGWWEKKLQAFIFPGEEFLTLPIETVKSPEFLKRVVNFNKGIALHEVPYVLKSSTYFINPTLLPK